MVLTFLSVSFSQRRCLQIWWLLSLRHGAQSPQLSFFWQPMHSPHRLRFFFVCNNKWLKREKEKHKNDFQNDSIKWKAKYKEKKIMCTNDTNEKKRKRVAKKFHQLNGFESRLVYISLIESSWFMFQLNGKMQWTLECANGNCIVSYLFVAIGVIITDAHRSDGTFEARRARNGCNLSRIAVASFHCTAFALGARFQWAGTDFSAILFPCIIGVMVAHGRFGLFNFYIAIEAVFEQRILKWRMMQTVFQLIVGRLVFDHGDNVILWRWRRIRCNRLIQLNVALVEILLLNGWNVARLYRCWYERIRARINSR